MKLPAAARIGEPGEWEPVPAPSGVSGFSEDESGLLLPSPKGKSVRQLVFRGGLLNVSETQEQIREIMRRAKDGGADWIEFTEGGYGTPITVPARALDALLWIQEAWIDIQGIVEQQKVQEMAQRLSRTGMNPVGKAVIPLGRRA